MSVLKLPSRPQASRLVLLIVAMFGWRYASPMVGTAETYPALVANSNQAPAGRLEQGVLRIGLEAAMGDWYPEEAAGPALRVAAFREAGGALSTPGPLIRVPEGTEIRVTVRNQLDGTLTLHGLHSRPGDAKDVVAVPPGESREVHFVAGAPGTYFYWASRNGAATLPQRRAEDGQLNGALLVDPKGASPQSDRILIITNWFMVDDDTVKPALVRDVLGINGLSWPHTERLTYRVGDSAHWRVINASSATHPIPCTCTGSIFMWTASAMLRATQSMRRTSGAWALPSCCDRAAHSRSPGLRTEAATGCFIAMYCRTFRRG